MVILSFQFLVSLILIYNFFMNAKLIKIIINSVIGKANHIPIAPNILGSIVKKNKVKTKTLKKEIIADLFPSPIDVNKSEVNIDIPLNRKLKENTLKAFVAISYTGLSQSQKNPVIVSAPKKEIKNINKDKIEINLMHNFISFLVYI